MSSRINCKILKRKINKIIKFFFDDKQKEKQKNNNKMAKYNNLLKFEIIKAN